MKTIPGPVRSQAAQRYAIDVVLPCALSNHYGCGSFTSGLDGSKNDEGHTDHATEGPTADGRLVIPIQATTGAGHERRIQEKGR